MAFPELFIASLADGGNMKIILLILVVIAVLLLFTGSTIALLTWRGKRKITPVDFTAEQFEAEKA